MAIDEKVRNAVNELRELIPKLKDSLALTPNVYQKLEDLFGILGDKNSVEVLQIYSNHGFLGYNAIVQQAEGMLKKYNSFK